MSDEHFIYPPINRKPTEADLDGSYLYRIRKFILTDRDILNVFFFRDRSDRDFLEFTELDLPADARVVAISSQTCPPALNVYVEHPSFDPVPPGDLPPQGMMTYRTVVLKKAGDNATLRYVCPTCREEWDEQESTVPVYEVQPDAVKESHEGS